MTRYDPERHHRRSIRLKGYDYTQPGAYFITICTYQRASLFGQVVDGEMAVNEWGKIVREEWFRTTRVRPYVELFDDEFVVMPNHIHGIIWIVDDKHVGAQRRCAPTVEITPTNVVPGSLGAIIRAFKSIVTKRINTLRGTPGASVWQRNYYEHIIRTERALNMIRRYIVENPLRWHIDRYNPNATDADPIAREQWRMLQSDAQAHVPGRGAAPLRPYNSHNNNQEATP